MCTNRWSVLRVPLLWNGKFGFDSESGQATDFKLSIHCFNALRSVGRASRQVHLLRRWKKRVNENLSSWSGRRMAVIPRAYDGASAAFSCQKNKNSKKSLYKLGTLSMFVIVYYIFCCTYVPIHYTDYNLPMTLEFKTRFWWGEEEPRSRR